LNFLDDAREGITFRHGNKEDLAAADLIDGVEMLDDDMPSADDLAGNNLLEKATERIVADDRHREGSVGAAEGRIGPLNKLGEVVDEGGFHLVFARRIVGAADRRERQHSHRGQEYESVGSPGHGHLFH
jgi:hypothetical protein